MQTNDRSRFKRLTQTCMKSHSHNPLKETSVMKKFALLALVAVTTTFVFGTSSASAGGPMLRGAGYGGGRPAGYCPPVGRPVVHCAPKYCAPLCRPVYVKQCAPICYTPAPVCYPQPVCEVPVQQPVCEVPVQPVCEVPVYTPICTPIYKAPCHPIYTTHCAPVYKPHCAPVFKPHCAPQYTASRGGFRR